MTSKHLQQSARVSRRNFVVGSAAAGGGLALGFNVPFGIDALAQRRRGRGQRLGRHQAGRHHA